MSKGIITTEQRQNQIISRLKNENAFLRAELKKRDEQIAVLEQKLEKALLYIEELQKYVFRGRKKKDKDKDDDKDDVDNGSNSSETKKGRSQESYRRPLPKEEEITDEEMHNIDYCPDCSAPLIRKALLSFYEEDVLPVKEWFSSLKRTKRIKVATAYCPLCKKRISAIPIPKQRVSIGENVKQLIAFQATVLQLSNSQIIDFLESHLQFRIAKGEIAHVLSEQARKLKPAFEDLLKSIREGQGVHMDETGYNIAFPDEYSGNYAWAMTGIATDNKNTVFVLGKNRGKGNAQNLLGGDYGGYGVSDDYSAYANIFANGKHALCWAHPKRKFKDLKNSPSLSQEKKESCRIFYEKFMGVYGHVIEINKREFEKEERKKAEEKLKHELKNILLPNLNEPTKLRTLKETMLKKNRLLFCLHKQPRHTDDQQQSRTLS